ncbi:HET-domain-containing protein [Zopfia rhizophila CBS 207.26]|uniref:HET-domain-containing protein n=1 Tax=Zopfia rhizophila CBS 207.26 TaxID=1314779 RepID=A0A6A6DPA1_9PEZI|nr:HET-domain-containing protein [Zopfia rhizophila CBS 207.26]
MRLLRLEDDGGFSLEECFGGDIPRYAILSHTWGKDHEEVTFQDLMEGTGKNKAGYRKLRFCGEQAAKDGLEHFWVDTCCIDKSSSTELSEAINSMFRWYYNAAKCYAYLSDVSNGGFPENHRSFRESIWFTRGWTLQELIAPSEIFFYSKNWETIGTKSQLVRPLEYITGVDARVLRGADPGICSIASRMSWAAKRVTKRVEDRAYSLLGIFDVHMPLLYGEGERSFIRLQEEIMRTSDDQSLFAWSSGDSICQPYSGLLASSPAYFTDSGKYSSIGLLNESRPSEMTNKGLCVEFCLQSYGREPGLYYARLECECAQTDEQPAIILQHISELKYGSQYVRVMADVLDTFKPTFFFGSINGTVYVRQNLFPALQPSRFVHVQDDIDLFWIRGTTDFQFPEPIPPVQWNEQTGLFGMHQGHIGRMLVTHRARKNRTICLLFTFWQGKPVCLLEDSQKLASHPEADDISGFGTLSQYRLWTDFFPRSGVFATARVNQVQVNLRRFTVVTLCLKTITERT